MCEATTGLAISWNIALKRIPIREMGVVSGPSADACCMYSGEANAKQVKTAHPSSPKDKP
jgi:hypothetical protein